MSDAHAIAEKKRKLVEARIRAAAARTNRQVTIPRAPREGRIPLSFAQQRLWFLDQLGAGTAYNLQLILRIDGPLDRVALERSVATVVARHESLRTTLPAPDGEPQQVIARTLDVPIATTDLRSLAHDDLMTERDRIVATDYGQAFDLATGPLVRAHLLLLAEDASELVLTIHHIITDAWSMVVLEGELLELYGAFRDGATPALPELPIQYPDFAIWQRQRMSGPTVDRLLEHWRERMDGATMLDLGDRQRPAAIENAGGATALQVAPELSRSIAALAREHQATTTMVTLAAFIVLLGRHSNQTDIVIGLPVTGREHCDLERLVGFFVNNLPIRVSLADDPTFIELIARVKKAMLSAYDHQDLPFERLIQELQPERQGGSNPLFEVVFAMNNVRRSAKSSRGGGATASGYRAVSKSRVTRFDLELHLTAVGDDLMGGLTYRKALFDPKSVAAMAEHYRSLLESVVADPSTRTSRLRLADADERRHLIECGQGAANGHPRDATMPDLFEAEAARRPNDVAIVCGDQRVTYRELDGRANRLAHHLVARGVGPDVMVGLCVERGVEMIVGMLAILKAGGGYVPLDPEYPVQRLAYMTRDTRAHVMLTLDRLRDRLPEHDGAVIALDTDWQAIEAEPDTPPARDIGPSSLAYVIYTSGSTGQPKGVCVEHRSVIRLVRNPSYVELGPDEVLLQFAPISFDASTFELWGSLLNGARLEVFPPHMPTLEELGSFIEERGVTTLWLTAALFQQMVDDHFGRLRNVRQLLAGGEALSAAHVRRALERLGPDQRLINGYGPTENTTFTCCHRMRVGDMFGRSVPIGRPISGTTVYILDDELEPVAVGEAGRLYTGGDGVARGYLNDASLTTSRFVPDPFESEPGARMYDTGDQARWRPDGTIEFLGREDEQVKVRGYRVELGEIETALVELTTVKAAAVTALQDENASRRLVAYVVPMNGVVPTSTELRQSVAGRLPGYMVPTQFVTLDALPLNANGKVDRAALPVPDEIASETTYVEPRTEVERVLVGIWTSFLPVERVGVHDNFFDLGGHSLVATRVLNQVRTETGVNLPLACLFDTPTVAGLAAAIDVLAANTNGVGHGDASHDDAREQIRI